MANLRILIVDDEPLARERLRTFLARESGVEVIGECCDGTEAVSAIPKLNPDLVFLDVQMPSCSGFEVLSRLAPHPHPRAVIFVTAHDKFALQAFEVHAVDYLLKPFDRTRLQTALRRVLDRLQSSHPEELQARLTSLLRGMQGTARSPERISVKSTGRVTLVDIPDIDWVGSADNYVELHVGTHCHLLRETMNNIAGKLPLEQFVRISRTTIVNVSRVKELRPSFHGEYAVILRDGTKLTLSRSHRDQLPRLGVR
ncbi:MAG: response regulator transcription factor [Pedosphaera sp.]|nr:response regulator transcription factor [Pedosphaera sp.]